MKRLEAVRPRVMREVKPGDVATHLMARSAGRGFGAPPRGARASFTGGRPGGTGWEIETPGGGAERHYAVISDAIRPGGFGFRDEVTPEEARHEPIVAKYIAHLREMSRSASEHFA